MKIQDLTFLVILAFLVWRQDQKLSVLLGLIALLVSIPLFATWTFFTAERLSWYAAAFFLLSVIFQLIKVQREKD